RPRARRAGAPVPRAALAAAAAPRSAAWYTVLASERGRAVAAVAGLHVDDGLVDELHGGPMTDMAPSAGARQPAGPTNRSMRWITAWTRAVVVPASRRAPGAPLRPAALPPGLFRPTPLRPSDLTSPAPRHPAV